MAVYCNVNLIYGRECHFLFIPPLPVASLPLPTNVSATTQSCGTVTLQWDQPSEPNGITTSVSCTPPSPGCAECTASPCTITGLNPSTDYVFTVTLNSGQCGASMNSTTASTMGEIKCVTGACMYMLLKLITSRHQLMGTYVDC